MNDGHPTAPGFLRRWRCTGAMLLALIGGSVALAHDALEITATVWLRAGALELELTMARSTAMAITDGTKEGLPFDPATFAALRPRFLACAPKLYAITAAGVPLAAHRAEVGLSVENDVEFRIVYPRPARGPLRFDAMHVAKLGYGHGDVLTVHGEHGELLGQTVLLGNDIRLEVALPFAPTVALPTSGPLAGVRQLLPFAALLISIVGGTLLWHRTVPA